MQDHESSPAIEQFEALIAVNYSPRTGRASSASMASDPSRALAIDVPLCPPRTWISPSTSSHIATPRYQELRIELVVVNMAPPWVLGTITV